MAVTAYNARIEIPAANKFKVTLHRNSTTQPVDPTSGAPNRVKIPFADYLTPPVQTTISAATNATPIVLTAGSATGFATDDIVRVDGVLGNTNANGTFKISVSGTSFTLVGSAGNAAFSTSPNATITKCLDAKTLQEAITQVMIAIADDYAANG